VLYMIVTDNGDGIESEHFTPTLPRLRSIWAFEQIDRLGMAWMDEKGKYMRMLASTYRSCRQEVSGFDCYSVVYM